MRSLERLRSSARTTGQPSSHIQRPRFSSSIPQVCQAATRYWHTTMNETTVGISMILSMIMTLALHKQVNIAGQSQIPWENRRFGVAALFPMFPRLLFCDSEARTEEWRHSYALL